MFNVTVRPTGQTIEVEIGSTILETALAAGIDYPHGCRAGNCGGCKSRLHEGDIEHSPYSEFALSPQELADGLILACRAVPWADCEVSWCELDDVSIHPVRDLKCCVTVVDKLTSDIVSVELNILQSEPFDFSSGQFVYLTFDGYPRREYSIANRKDESTLEFYIRRVDGGAVSSFAVDFLTAGENVHLQGPHGNMFFCERHEGPVIAIAGGSGLSAVQSIVIDALESNFTRPVSLYHGVRDESDIFRAQLFEQLEQKHANFSYKPVLSEPSKVTNFSTGMLFEVLPGDLGETSDLKAYLAGPPPMVRSCAEVLKEKGVTDSNIHADPFFTTADQAI